MPFLPSRRQSYNVNLEVRIEGTTTVATNCLDLKNPYFRYTGVAPQPPPGNNTVSPSESYWSTVDAQGAKQGEVLAKEAVSGCNQGLVVMYVVGVMDSVSVSLAV